MADRSEILVHGTLRTSEDGLEEMLEQSLAHVRRSRSEPGCLFHSVARDVEDPLLLVFVERWADRATLDLHFTQPGSLEFVEVVGRLAVARPTLDIYAAARQ